MWARIGREQEEKRGKGWGGIRWKSGKTKGRRREKE